MARLHDCSTTIIPPAPFLITQLPHRYHQAFIHYQLHLQASGFDTTRFKHQFRTFPARPIPSLADAITSFSGKKEKHHNHVPPEPPSPQHRMAALTMVMSTMEDLMRRMNWTKDEEKMVIIISVTVSPT
jgi:hypothetical protein